MPTPLIIGFGHKARNGKDEAVKAILDSIGGTMNARAYGFGDALKREVNEAARIVGGMKALFELLQLMDTTVIAMNIPAIVAGAPPLPDWVVYDENAPMDDPLSPYGKQRTLLQWWGTEFRREQDPNYWVRKTFEQMAEDNPEVALIRDLRFPNEFRAVHEAGGYNVKVVREGFISDVPEHYSEKALDDLSPLDWDYVLSVPDGQLDLLKKEAVNMFRSLWDLHRSKPYVTAAAEQGDDNDTVEQLPQTHLPVDHGMKDWTQRFCR